MKVLREKIAVYMCCVVMCLFHGLKGSNIKPSKKSDFTPAKKQPNIIFILADDLGYNDVGYNGKLHGSAVKTPNIDRLASRGVILGNYYVQHLCTPTRSQLMTGRYQIHTGMQHTNVTPNRPYCLPLDEVTLAQKLKEAGYATHMIGKWHLGHQKTECLPTKRGFDTFLGLYLGSGDHFTHVKHWRKGGIDLVGYDFHRDTRNNTTVGYKYDGEYSTHTFSKRAQNLIKQHRKKKPLFMYLSFQAPHGPLQVPSRYKKPFQDTLMKGDRKTLAAMVYCMDEAIGEIVEVLKKSGLYKNTVIIFSTDNGGAKETPASNWPYRGSKGTFWEGGFHGVGFIHSPLLPKEVRGTTNQAFIHVSDWFPTIVSSLAGGSLNGTKPLDGYDVWESIKFGNPSPRTELLHNINPKIAKGFDPELTLFNTSVKAALRMGDWKLLTGDQGDGVWTAPPESDFDSIHLVEPSDKNVWLFNIKADPYEKHDVSDSNPSVVRQMITRLEKYYCKMAAPLFPRVDWMYDPSNYGNVWGPWTITPESSKLFKKMNHEKNVTYSSQKRQSKENKEIKKTKKEQMSKKKKEKMSRKKKDKTSKKKEDKTSKKKKEKSQKKTAKSVHEETEELPAKKSQKIKKKPSKKSDIVYCI